jgi:hypothetical protein
VGSGVKVYTKKGGGGDGALVRIGPDYGDGSADGITHGIGIQTRMPALAYSHQREIGIHLDMPSLRLAYADPRNTGIHIAGSVLGAPFWQSIGTGFLGGATVTADTNIVITKPPNLAVGDFMIAHIAAIGVGVVPLLTPPAGWFLIENPPNVTLQKSAVWYKFANAADVAAANFTWVSTAAGGTSLALGEIHRVIAVRNPDPIDISTSETGNVTDPVVDAVTTTVINCLVFVFVDHNHAALSQTHGFPAGHVERIDAEDGAVAKLGMTSATRVFAAASSTGTVTVDCTEAVATDYCAYRIAVAPTSLTLAS